MKSIYPLLTSPLARGRNLTLCLQQSRICPLPLPRGGLGWGEIFRHQGKGFYARRS